jgi:hypothetical protein
MASRLTLYVSPILLQNATVLTMVRNMKNEIPQLPVDNKKLYANPLKSILYLYGQHNAGKSTTLGWLIFYLAYCGKEDSFVYEQFNYWKKKLKKRNKRKNSFPDIRVIVPYEGKYVYIALYGDNLEATEANVFFFEGRLDYKKIRIFDSQVRPLEDNEKDYYKQYTPSVCVSASFYSRLVEEPLWYFAGKKHFSTCMTNWVYIPRNNDKDDSSIEKKSKNYARLLKRLIDESLKLSLN